MPRQKVGAELESLREQQIELVKRIKEAEAKERLKAKLDNERREQLAGRLILARLRDQPDCDAARSFRSLLETAPFRPADKALFAAVLPPAPVQVPEAAE